MHPAKIRLRPVLMGFLALVLTTACSDSKPNRLASPSSQVHLWGPVLAAIDARGTVALFDGASGVRLAERATGPGTYQDVGGVLAVDSSRHVLWVLTAFVSFEVPQQALALDSKSLEPIAVLQLPYPRTAFRTIVVGTDTGYVVGNVGGTTVIVLELNLTTREVAADPFEFNPGAGSNSWPVMGVSLSRNERTLFVSYHGGSTTGTDVLVRDGPKWKQTCPLTRPDRPSNVGCLENHGMVLPLEQGILATTGSPIVELYDSSWERQNLDSRLEGNHLMRLAPGPGRTAVAVGSCASVPGLSILRPDEGTATLLNSETCGDVLAVDDAGRIAVARNIAQPPNPARPGAVVLERLAGDRSVRHISLPSEAIDLCWIP